MWLGPKGGLVEAVAELRVESQAGLELQAGEQGRGVEAGRLGLHSGLSAQTAPRTVGGDDLAGPGASGEAWWRARRRAEARRVRAQGTTWQSPPARPRCPGSSRPAPEARLPGSRGGRIPVSGDCHPELCMIQGLPRAGESHTCSPPAAGATARNQCPCPPTTQPPSVPRSPARP